MVDLGRPESASRRHGPSVLVGAVIGFLAFFIRLMVTVRGGGLFGLGNYDDGVYFSAALGLVHGRLPYRDFVLLHPPGVIVALAPFAALADLIGDPTAFAIARLAWMVLGAINVVLVFKILRPAGLIAAAAGGLFYAVFYPAVYSEHTTLLEGLSTTALLVALVMILGSRQLTRPVLLGAGALLGFAVTVKIWGVVFVAVVVVWLTLTQRWQRSRWLLLGSIVGATVICLPFFLTAPAAMWRLVVMDQVGRASSSAGTTERLARIVDQGQGGSWTAVVTAVLVLVVIMSGIALASRLGRLAVPLLVVCSAVLFSAPSWFPHYAALVGAPMALVVGAAIGIADQFLRTHRATVGRWLLASAVLVALAAYADPLLNASPGQRFPAAALAPAAIEARGCITADDQNALIELNVASRNLRRGCSFVADLGGRSYEHPAPAATSRAKDLSWQKYALSHLRSGELMLTVRYRAGKGFSRKTLATIRSWPSVAQAGRYHLRRPPAAVASR